MMSWLCIRCKLFLFKLELNLDPRVDTRACDRQQTKIWSSLFPFPILWGVPFNEEVNWNCHIGPVRTTRNFFCFAKKSVNAKPFSVRTIFFVHENFVKRHQTSKTPSSSFGGLFFLSSEKIYCSVTATLQRVIIFRNRYHTKWYCVRDPIYRHLEMDRRGEMSDRDSDPAPFVRNSYIPETQQYNYYGSQCYYEEPQALPQYYYFPQSQPQGPQVEGAGASMRNINSRNKVPVASESTAESNEGAKTSGKRKSTKYETFPHAEERYLVNLWKENHDQLESKNARKVWSKIVDDLNTRFKSNRTVDKCMRKIKYLIDKYKEKKDWNRNQSGGNLRKSPFYDEIDEVLGCCDFVTFSNVKESAVVSPNASTSSASTSASTSASSSPKGSVVDSDVANHEKSPDDVTFSHSHLVSISLNDVKSKHILRLMLLNLFIHVTSKK